MRAIIYLALVLLVALQGCGNNVDYELNGAQASPSGSVSTSPSTSPQVITSPLPGSPTVSPSPRL